MPESKLMRKCPKCKTFYEFKKTDVRQKKRDYTNIENDLILIFKCPVCDEEEKMEVNPMKLPGMSPA